MRVLLLDHPSPELPGTGLMGLLPISDLGLALGIQRLLRQGRCLCEDRLKPGKLQVKPCEPVSGAEPEVGAARGVGDEPVL